MMKAILTYLGVAGCTVLLYYLTFEEHANLFYWNVAIACVVEAILLGNLPFLSNEKWLTFKNAASYLVLNSFALVLFSWTTFYTLAIADGNNFDTLYIGLAAIGIVFIALLGVVEVGGGFMQKQEAVMKQSIAVKKRTLVSIELYWVEIQDELNHQTDWEEEALRNIRLILDKIASIPAGKIERSSDVIAEINGKLESLKDKILDISSAEVPEKAQQEISKQIQRIANYVVAVKTTL